MSYWAMRRLVGGTYTPGTDWAAQFASLSASALATGAGEAVLPSDTAGRCLTIAVRVLNTSALVLRLDCSVSVQIQVGGVRTESGAGDLVLPTPPMIGTGYVPIIVVVPSGALSLQPVGPVFGGADGAAFLSSFPQGADPYRSGGSSASDTPSGPTL